MTLYNLGSLICRAFVVWRRRNIKDVYRSWLTVRVLKVQFQQRSTLRFGAVPYLLTTIEFWIILRFRRNKLISKCYSVRIWGRNNDYFLAAIMLKYIIYRSFKARKFKFWISTDGEITMKHASCTFWLRRCFRDVLSYIGRALLTVKSWRWPPGLRTRWIL